MIMHSTQRESARGWMDSRQMRIRNTAVNPCLCERQSSMGGKKNETGKRTGGEKDTLESKVRRRMMWSAEKKGLHV